MELVHVLIFKNYITWNKDCKKRKENKQGSACCYHTLTKPKKQGLSKPARFSILEVLKYVKA